MEYTDYKSGKLISREQYIANGLERGELLVSEACGCKVIQDRTADAYIVYCHKHDAAPDMYEALKAFLAIEYPPDIADWLSEAFPEAHEMAQEALSKAEGAS